MTAAVYEMAIKEANGGTICSIEGALKALGIKHNRTEQARYRDIFRNAGIPMGELSKIIKSGSQAGKVQVYHYIATQHLARAGQALVIS